MSSKIILIISTLLIIFITNLASAQLASGTCPDDSPSCNEPPVQPGEDVLDFKKGLGGKPKNDKSAKVKGVKFNKPILGGTGCEQGTVTTVLSPDSKLLSIFFDNYVAEAGSNKSLKRDIKTCAAVIPFEVPAGFQFALVKLDYRGFNSIPKNGKTKYVTIYSMLDTNNMQIGRRIRRQYLFNGPLQEDYIISSDVSTQPTFSPCGKNINFRIDTRAVAVSNKKGETAIATIDSIDAAANASVDYHLLWQECKANSGGGPKPGDGGDNPGDSNGGGNGKPPGGGHKPPGWGGGKPKPHGGGWDHNH